MKPQVKIVLAVLAATAIIGVLIPTLLSAKSTIAVWVGLAAIVAFIVWGLNVLKRVIDSAKDKECKGGCKCNHSHVAMLFLILATSFSMSACGVTSVPAGHVGVKVYLLGGDKGVDAEVLPVGRYFLTINEEIYLFPTYNVNYVWTQASDEGSPNDESITFQDRDGLAINGDFGIEYAIEPTMVATLFQTYRKGVAEITDIVLRNKVRDSITKLSSSLSAEELYSSKKNWLMSTVEDDVRKQMLPIGIKVLKIYVINNFRLPSEVVNSINAKIQATQNAQRIQNEVESARAEADKKIQEARGQAESLLMVAKAEAEANQLKQRTLTKELIEYEAVQKWNGQLPQVSGNNTPFINIGK